MERGQSSEEDNSRKAEQMPEEDNRRCTSSTRVIGPLIIDSLNIDLGVLPVKRKDHHKHFSIRGYVSDVRDQGLHDCRPFPTMELEPLVVPIFRDWRCEQCLQDIHEQQQPEATQQVGNSAANVHAQNDDGECNNDIQQTVDRASHSPSVVQENHEAHALATNHEITHEAPERIMTRQRSKRRVTFDEATISAKENETKRPSKLQLKQRRKPRKMRLLSDIYARTESDVEYYKTKDAQGSDTLNETLIELTDLSRKRKRSLSQSPPRETPSKVSEDGDVTEVVRGVHTEPAVASANAHESGAMENASRSSTYIPPEENGDAGFASKTKGKRHLYEDGMKFTNFEGGESSKLSDKFLKYDGGKMQQQKALSNFEIGESFHTKGCFWEEMMDHVNESLARTAEYLRLQFPGEKAECLSGEAPHNNVPTATVRPDNISGNVMEFDLNLLPTREADTARDLDYEAALQMLRLGDDEYLNCVLNRNPADLSSVDEENEYMIELINKNDKKKKDE